MPNLANEILEFFSINTISNSFVKKQTPKSIDEFVSQAQHIDSLDLHKFVKTISILKNEGHLISAGLLPNGNIPIANELLIAPSYDEEFADYGSYNFLIHGFVSIAETFSNSVRPIVVLSKDGIPDIGTAFLLGNIHTIITARHVVENAKLITITNDKGEFAKIKHISFPNDKNIDIAFILIENFVFSHCKPFNATNAKILENVLTIGYPPIPGFDAFQLYEISSINNSYKFSNGQIIGKENSYLDGIEYLILNAKVKGGNSGSPVINNKGNIVGMVIQIPMDSKDAEKIDKLGYGIVTPFSEIRKYLNGSEKFVELTTFICENNKEGAIMIK
ncbi:S1 family peptidase [Chryseobacterium salivictor]|uniref:Serine protease SplC n=1 Tax=Chryseobacterium salivictor TaxID=2547600 RepID=A0A4P6ZFW9_9FLAO|nr:serine protease [Chryseobacterium salivictor]QBO58392.1 Serine protease SplC [Chryseobacterium salivictor]